MPVKDKDSPRIFKTAWFNKAAKKAHISDDELCLAIRQVIQGQVDDLGGGVFKKRLSDNNYRSIILTKSGKFWIYTYLFAKKDRGNIDVAELAEFKKLAKLYSRQPDSIIDTEIKNGDLLEICNVKET
ncbi:type II toxin-antitoxin system RelE/ParE family toxin [Methyloglobulus sp.]|uniref:type II toxin-antitoxin system RelE/ParE family toxin n=1 Tax=Methyloglobulus sp. TaxID=2518622 RepID=UPI00184BB996|nr:type II toxin-antitoxin system RelE/ParE family toxin [Methyloglobulus sp.]